MTTRAQLLAELEALGVGGPSGISYLVASSTATSAQRSNADYVCDGTADDVQIQAAIAALPASGGTVQLTEGTFTLAAAVVPVAGLRLVGMGPTSILKVGDGANVRGIAYVAGAISDVFIEDLTVDGNGTNQTHQADSTALVGIKIANVTNLRIRGVHVKNVRHGGGIQVTSCALVEIADVYGLDNGVAADATKCDHMLVADSSIVTIHGCRLFTCTDTGIALDGNTYVSATGNIIVGAAVQGMTAASSASNAGSMMMLADNIIDGIAVSGADGIRCTDTGAGLPQLVMLNNNHIRGVDIGIALDNVLHCVISNPFISCADAGAARWGILFGNSSFGVRLDGGKIRNCAEAFDIGATAGAVEIDGTDVLDTNTSVFGAQAPAVGSLVRLPGTSRKAGATSVADGGTIAHGLYTTPTRVTVTPSVANELVAVTALAATTFTVAIKKRADGTAGTTQTVYWDAEKVY